MVNGRSPLNRQLRQPRLAEMVAAALRDRILSGALEDGSMLPKQDELLAEFGVSLPPIREALRILETEGLVTVQRGNVGGAVVHRPQPYKAAYMLGLVLQSRGANLGDVLRGLIAFEPACAAACAAREDRATTVLPRLRATLDQAAAVVEDGDAYTGLARQFHIDLVESCGNEAMIQVVGALEALWTAHVNQLARRNAELGSFAEPTARKTSVKEHELLYRAIEAGDTARAEHLAKAHYSHPQDPGWGDSLAAGRPINALYIRDL
ncbi:MAG: FadR family transcriptional regulator [Ilumatobacteraceae bacterium]|nr:FadR family transcriptional regulator [Ilumatobacteraceae bacterium]